MIFLHRHSPRGRARLAVVLVLALLAVGAGLFVLFGPRRGNGTSVLLITLDSTRADRLGCYGGPVKTPQLDALAAQGVRFAQAYTAAPLCLAGHASILTGRYPHHHGLRDETQDLGPGTATAAELFHRAGYRTAAVVGSSMLDRGRGLARGFDDYLDDLGHPGKRPGRGERENAEQVVDRALGWLSSAGKEQPLFLWVHLSDAKPPHEPPADLAAEYAGRPYDGEVAALDRAVGRLVAQVRAARPQIAVAVVADHGNGLGEHGEDSFGYFLYGSTTRVPMLLSLPGGRGAGTTVAPVVRSVDLLPTLLDACGLRVPRSDGRSLLPLVDGRTHDGPGPAVIENFDLSRAYGLAPLWALRAGDRLYVRAPRAELYDVAKDPQEKEDLIAHEASAAREMERALPSEAPAKGKAAADPKDFLDLYRRFRAAEALDDAGNRTQAIVVYRSILSEAPDFSLARVRESEALVRENRLPEAQLELAELIKRGEAIDGTYLNIALTYHRSGSTDKALEWLKKGLAAFPRSAPLHHRTGRVLLLLKKPDEAVPEFEKTLELDPRFLDARLALGLAEQARGRADAARAAFQEVQKLSPDAPEAKEAADALAGKTASPAPASPAARDLEGRK